MKEKDIEKKKKEIIEAGCPLNRWGVGTSVLDTSILYFKQINLKDINKDTPCGKYSKEIDEIGDYEYAKNKKIKYEGVPSGLKFITNTYETKETALKKAMKKYGDACEIHIKDEAYYFINIADGVQKLEESVAVFIKKR